MAQRLSRGRAYLLACGFAFLLVLLPFLFWYGTWFGRKLTDAEIDRYLHDPSKARKIQHALVQIGERISRGDTRVRRWYPEVAALAGSPIVELRQTAAWIMGQDHSYAPFHGALHTLLEDPSPMVRRNAALSLSNFRDPAARSELRAMLRDWAIVSPASGSVKYRLKTGEYVNPGTLVGRVGNIEVRAPVPGEVRSLGQRDGANVRTGDPLAELAPDKNHAWEALRALLAVGGNEDLEEVQRYARGVPGMPDRLRQQAALTMQEIRSRQELAR